jgi:penicillin amidase
MFKQLGKITTNSPLLTRLAIFILLPLLVGCWLMVAELNDNLAPDGLTKITRGVSAPVSIMRDVHGVPHIEASSDEDAFFAIGYVHAQDRLWQLEVQRHLAQGRLSEMFGLASVQRDIWFRTLGLYDSAKSAWPTLSKEAQDSLTAYTAGINAAMADQTSLPPEFRILGITPVPWTVYDSLAGIKLFALNLGSNFSAEMGRFLASQTLDAEQIAVLFPDNGLGAPTTIKAAIPPEVTKPALGVLDLGKMLAFQKTELEQGLGIGGRGVGSNAWVVAGKHTANKAALLANDPHLSLQIPSIWYVLSAKGKTLDVSGMSMVGLPLVIFGSNDKISWGGTNMLADAQDLYFEHADPADPTRYEVNGKWEKFATRQEAIAVRADFPQFLHKQYKPITVQIRSSRNGPIASDQFNAFGQAVALRWTALEPGDTSYEAFYRLNFATDWATFNKALYLHVAPALNMVYADRQGNIGYLGAGKIPVRKKGDGSTPASGRNDDYAWSGYIPPEQLPHSYNPESGYIVTANNKIVGEQYPYFISRDWASPARARRIEQLLQEKLAKNKVLTLEDMQQMQADTMDLEARDIMTELVNLTPGNEDQRQAFTYLKQWNGDMSEGSQAASIFNAWMRHFRKRLLNEQLKRYWNKPEQAGIVRIYRDDVSLKTLQHILKQKNTIWCKSEATPSRESCDDVLRNSLQSALDELYDLKGDHSMASWRWGELQASLYLHTPFSQVKPLDKFFERRIGNAGSENSISVASSKFEDKKGNLQYLGAGFRQVIQLDPKQILITYMNSTGQSGNLLSPHYDDMVEPFRNVDFYRLEGVQKSEESK